MLDLAIIGSGPAALTAALYAARAGLDVTVFEKKSFGGALSEIPSLENFPGFSGKGADLAENLKKQAISAGAKLEYGECTSVSPKLLIDDEEIPTRAVLIATGSEPKTLDIETSTPVSYCALCDAPLYKGKNVIVIGGGNSAASEALYLSDLVSHLTLASHSPMRAEKTLLAQLSSRYNIKILENTEITRELLDNYDGVFVCIGKRPATSFLPKEILNNDGFILTKPDFSTSVKGIFAAGDVRFGSVKQAVSAAAEGANAAISIINYLKTSK